MCVADILRFLRVDSRSRLRSPPPFRLANPPLPNLVPVPTPGLESSGGAVGAELPVAAVCGGPVGFCGENPSALLRGRGSLRLK
ncbi:hypothetical protein NL676_031969 [Syzygium grande]|nr:hypothetical protein NL676_031969 [Syzygium grande]